MITQPASSFLFMSSLSLYGGSYGIRTRDLPAAGRLLFHLS